MNSVLIEMREKLRS